MKNLLVFLKAILRQFPLITPKGIIYSTKEWIVNRNKFIDWYSRKNSDWYLTFYPETITYYDSPKTIHQHLSIYFKYQLVKKQLEVNLYYLKGAYVFSDYGIIISRENKIFDEFCHYFNTKTIKEGDVYRPFKTFKTKITKIPENAAVLASPESSNYYHWMMDCLPRLHLLETFIDSIDYFIVPDKLHGFHIESLKYWGIDESRLIRMKKTDKLYFDNLYVPSLPGSEGNSPQWAIEFLREKFLNLNNSSSQKDLVYFSRKNAGERHIVNEEEVLEVLNNRGFKIYEMSEYTLAEQIKISHNAKMIVSVHGAALTNLLFTNNDCQILEIFSPDYIRPDCYFTLANQLKLDYWYLMGNNQYQDKRLAWGDIYIDISNFKLTLDRMLNS